MPKKAASVPTEHKTQKPGVYRCTWSNRPGVVRYRGRITRNGKKIDLGYYHAFEVCAEVVEAARLYYGKNYHVVTTSTAGQYIRDARGHLIEGETGKTIRSQKSEHTKELESKVGKLNYQLLRARRDLAASVHDDKKNAALSASREKTRHEIVIEETKRHAREVAARLTAADRHNDIC